MDLIPVSYPLIKSEASSKGLKYFYTELFAADGITTAGYNVFAMSPFYGLTTSISSAPDIADFNANIKPIATAVGDQYEASARVELAQISSMILPGNNSGRSFGYLATAAITSVTVRATTYTPQGTNAQRSFSSTSANDTAAGTGARQIRITYLDASGAGPFTETITLNGAAAVNSVNTNIALIERMDVVAVGSGGGNAGTIRIHTLVAGGGAIWGSIAVGDNQTFWAHHYVPTGKTCYVTNIEGSATVVAGGLTVNTANPVTLTVPQTAPDITIRHATVHVFRQYTVPVPVVGPAIIFVNERPDAVTASTVFASFGWIQQ